MTPHESSCAAAGSFCVHRTPWRYWSGTRGSTLARERSTSCQNKWGGSTDRGMSASLHDASHDRLSRPRSNLAMSWRSVNGDTVRLTSPDTTTVFTVADSERLARELFSV